MPTANILATASGNTQVVAAPSAGFIRVIGYQIVGKDSDTTVQLRSGPTTVKARCFTPATGVGGIACPPVEAHSEPYFECTALEALNVNLSGVGNAGVNVQYLIVN